MTGSKEANTTVGQAADEVDGHIPCMDQDDADLTQPPESELLLELHAILCFLYG